MKTGQKLPNIFGSLTDITAQRQSEDAVRIAHEINQPLMSIMANAGASPRWLKREPANLENASSSLDEIIREGRRTGDIIRGLQALTRNQIAEFAPAKMHLIPRDIIVLSRLELERRLVLNEIMDKNDSSF